MGFYKFTKAEIAKIDPEAIPDGFYEFFSGLPEKEQLKIRQQYPKLSEYLETASSDWPELIQKLFPESKKKNTSIQLFGKPHIFYITRWRETGNKCPNDGGKLELRSFIVKLGNSNLRFDAWKCSKCNGLFMRKADALELKAKTPAIKFTKARYPLTLVSDSPDITILKGGNYPNVGLCDPVTEAERAVIGLPKECETKKHRIDRDLRVLLWIDLAGRTKKKQKSCLIHASYCENCEKYYIARGTYETICRYGRPCLSIYDPAIEYFVPEPVSSGHEFEEEVKLLKEVQKKNNERIKAAQERLRPVPKHETIRGGYDDGGLWNQKHDYDASKALIDKWIDFGKKPYSYRVELSGKKASPTYYLGERTLSDPAILDAPFISKENRDIYNQIIQYREGEVSIDGVSYTVKRKREYDIEDGKLQKYTDTSYEGGVTDLFLTQVLRRRRADHQSVDILPTIQKNQDTIVREPLDHHIIVQGCAGSGKTAVMLQRLVDLRYRAHGLNLKRTLILTPSKNYNLHISDIAESLQLTSIKWLSVEEYYERLLEKYNRAFRLKYDITEESKVPSQFLDFIYSEEFLSIFWEAYKEEMDILRGFYEQVYRCAEFVLGKREAVRNKTVDKTPTLPLLSLANAINDRIKSEIREKNANSRQDVYNKRIPRKTEGREEIIRILDQLEDFSIKTIYNAIYSTASNEADERLFARTGKRYLGSTRGTHRYDLYLQLLFAQKVYGYNVGDSSLICVDEGQDMSLSEYALVRGINPDGCVFNIYGDARQLLKPKRGIKKWSDLENVLNNPVYFKLNENFRNTNQITQFCNDAFSMNIATTGLDGSHVLEITQYRFEEQLAGLSIGNERIAIIIPRKMKKSFLDHIRLSDSVREALGEQVGYGRICVAYVEEIKGIEFDRVYVFVNGLSTNERYIAYTRALSELTLVHDTDDLLTDEKCRYILDCRKCGKRIPMNSFEWSKFKSKDLVLNAICLECRQYYKQLEQSKLAYTNALCKDCKRRFTIYEYEKERCDVMELPLPKRCPKCRKKEVG